MTTSATQFLSKPAGGANESIQQFWRTSVIGIRLRHITLSLTNSRKVA